jgi:hypothetical protein
VKSARTSGEASCFSVLNSMCNISNDFRLFRRSSALFFEVGRFDPVSSSCPYSNSGGIRVTRRQIRVFSTA